MAEDATVLSADTSAPRIKLSENGFAGLHLASNRIVEEANRAFRYPEFHKIVDEMRNDATISAALTGNRLMAGRVQWQVIAPAESSEQDKKRAEFVQSCFHDMEHTWQEFISEVMTYLEYGFAVHEKVWRRRLKRNGSKYDDGLVGIRKLAPRSQVTITDWIFSDDGRDLVACEQSITGVNNQNRYKSVVSAKGSKVKIPRKDFLLFRADPTRDNPEGRSILKGVYVAYRQMQLIQEQQMIGIARDLGGVPVLWLPPKYMSADASAEEKAVYQSFIQIGANLTTGAQQTAVLPLMYDENGNKIFSMDLLESKGGKNFDTTAIIEQLQKSVLRGLYWDVLTLTGNTSDNFSITQGRTNLTALHLGFRLEELASVINNDLIPHLYKLNGWELSNLPKLQFSDFDEIDLESFSKAVQRMASTGMLERDRPMMNLVRERLGVALKPDDEPVNMDELTNNDSRSGDSFDTPTGGLEGTRKSVSGRDNSSDNLDNAG